MDAKYTQIDEIKENKSNDQAQPKRKLRKVVTHYENGFVKEEYYVIVPEIEASDELVKHGLYKMYFDTGVLKLILRYADGKLNGPAAEYHPNGQVNVYKTIKDGKLHGDYTAFSKGGRLIHKSLYNNGAEVCCHTREDELPVIEKYNGVHCVIC